MDAPAPRPRLVHVARVGCGKWDPFGVAYCGCTISRYTPTAPKGGGDYGHGPATCQRCLKAVAKAANENTEP